MCNLEQNLKPRVTTRRLIKYLAAQYGLRNGTIGELYGYDDLNFHFLPLCGENRYIDQLCPLGYIVKVMNSKDSENADYCDAQSRLLAFLGENGIPCPKIIRTTEGSFHYKANFSRIPFSKPRMHVIRVFEYQPGVTLKETPKSFSLLYDLGIFLGNLDEILKGFHHKFYDTHKSEWHLNSVPAVRVLTDIIEDPERKELVDTVIDKFIEEVASKRDTLEKGMIHGDFNEHNILMILGEESDWEVSAILDFGDSHYSNYLFELAIAMCYMMIECKENNLDPVEGAGNLLAGYLTVRLDFLVDISLLKTCICARMCQSLVLGLHASRIQPENEYVLSSQRVGWQILEEFWPIPEEELTKKWDSVLETYDIKRPTQEEDS